MTVTTKQVLMHAPTAASYTGSATVNGRTFVAAAGTPIAVPDYDAIALEAAGFSSLGPTGTTAQRPKNPVRGDTYQDSTLGVSAYFDGKTWRNQVTGASV